jgi:hypothetical protein
MPVQVRWSHQISLDQEYTVLHEFRGQITEPNFMLGALTGATTGTGVEHVATRANICLLDGQPLILQLASISEGCSTICW